MKKTPTNPKGAGRPKGIETTTIRVPLCLKEIIQRFIIRKQLKKEEKL